MISGIVFDMDGILFDTENLAVEAWAHAGAQLGVEIPRDLVLSFIGRVMPDVRSRFDERFTDVPGFDFDTARRLFRAHIDDSIAQHGIPLKPGLHDTLAALSGRGLRIALATSTERTKAEHHLELAGIRAYFETCVCGDQVAHGKPAPDIYLEACRRLALPPEDCMTVEDSFAGVRAAHAAGTRTVMIPDLLQPDEELRPHCHAILPSLHEVIALLERRPSAEMIFN